MMKSRMCLFGPPHPSPAPHSTPVPSVPCWQSQKVSHPAAMWEHGTAWGQRGAERRQAVLPANSPSLGLLPKRSHVSTWLSLPPCQFPFYQGALQFLKELLKTYNFSRPQWKNFSRCHSRRCDQQCVEAIPPQHIKNPAQYLLSSLPALKISLGDRKESYKPWTF